MNALWRPPELHAAPMSAADLDAVMAIERAAYPFPWTRGNFIDSLAAGYDMPTLRDAAGAILAYSVAMDGVQEAHLLNLTVAPAWQRRGLALVLLDALVARARRLGHARLWLEVRESNARAQAVYARYGFTEAGVRRAYYPADGSRREDARVMTLDLAPEAHA
jgi:[ribosomal protein S18]-alanine N-acetyltransferase